MTAAVSGIPTKSRIIEPFAQYHELSDSSYEQLSLAESCANLCGFGLHLLRKTLVRALQHLAESIEKRRLAFQNTLSALGDGTPTPAIHLGNFDHTAGARRPLHVAAIADHRSGVAIAFKGPSG